MYKTVPTIFKQSCTIHRRIDGDDRDGNSQIMSLVFALMSSKSKECYRTLFWDLIDFSDENNIYLYLQFVSTDFEQAAFGLIIPYGTDGNFSLLIRHISALAFLPHNEIPAVLMIRSEPLFPPSLWSVTDNIEHIFSQNQNNVEVCHRRRETLVGHAHHVGVFKIIKELQNEQKQVYRNNFAKAPRSSQRKQNYEHEDRI
ncbi:hypothetical protein RhiirA5_506519 [Rhizophagus irregularis]|uniref:Uncharacterized protein n=2 Tax=Rhizophagus irregularis TaxID=588596 RepID=U9UR35_RHIID|nr:hypothetical protein GLOIN_2v1871051 [Rhizophagus irregularis DAOM 181602=DAOM 197198]PKB97654.1 hypothetical protein RhiirA5_506519 [Rhizophagus irregularis]POG77838.1 hypothetical protein GLOIN_2v1871051 [Rhizophagus irregularis DAOM 181602=DAOM 197198]|eukprot:XP_025184704.1 hypothetical protein GLOIN_2v1871051 [Rhizophagus irregularis DAOM 181602=DAOM 197198]